MAGRRERKPQPHYPPNEDGYEYNAHMCKPITGPPGELNAILRATDPVEDMKRINDEERTRRNEPERLVGLPQNRALVDALKALPEGGMLPVSEYAQEPSASATDFTRISS
jgi:hypothetical protein